MSSEKKVLIEGLLKEVKFKIDLLDHDLKSYKKFEKSLRKIKSYFKECGVDYIKDMAYSVSSTKTSSYRDGEMKKKSKDVARLKLDKFNTKVKECNSTESKVKKDILSIIEECGLDVISVKFRENKPEELIITIKL